MNLKTQMKPFFILITKSTTKIRFYIMIENIDSKTNKSNTLNTILLQVNETMLLIKKSYMSVTNHYQ